MTEIGNSPESDSTQRIDDSPESEQLQSDNPTAETIAESEEPIAEEPIAESIAEPKEESIAESVAEPIAESIDSTLQREQENWSSDHRSLTEYYEQACEEQKKGEILLKNVQSFLATSNQIFSDNMEIAQSLPTELQERLKGRLEGLEILRKMTSRLPEQAQELIEDVLPEDLNNLPNKQELQDKLPTEIKEPKSVAEFLEHEFKVFGNERWQKVTKMRDTAQARRKRLLHFIGKKLLPIMDGLDSGKGYSISLIASMKEENPEQSEQLTSWFSIYDLLEEQLLDLFLQLGVHQMKIDRGTPIDYNRHDPIDVEADNTLQTEDIKEVSRAGYEYELTPDSRIVLRCAEVIVVKN